MSVYLRSAVRWGAALVVVGGCGDDEGAAAASGGSGGTAATETLGVQPNEDPTSTGDVGTLDPTAAGGSLTGGSSSGARSSTDGGGEPEIQVLVGGTEVLDGRIFAFEDPVDVFATGAPVTVEVTNIGNSDLVVSGVSLAGAASHFVLDSADFASAVAPGESSSFTVAFAPANGGVKAATFTVESNDGDEGAFTVGFTARTQPNMFRLLEPEVSPSGRLNPSMTGLVDGRVLLFGGRDGDGTFLDDTWVYDVEGNAWTQITAPDSPSARQAATLVGLSDGDAYLFGGVSQEEGEGLEETWQFDADADRWVLLAPTESPPSRFQHAAIQIAGTEMMVWGGQGPDSLLSDELWIFDAADRSWTQVFADGAPAGRRGAGLGRLDANTVLLFGGLDGGFAVDDETWTFDIQTRAWTPLVIDAPVPGRFQAVSAAFDNGYVVFSGKVDGCCDDPEPGTFHYDPQVGEWADITPALEPAARFAAGLAYLGRNKAILFGGDVSNNGPTGALSDTWEYVGP